MAKTKTPITPLYLSIRLQRPNAHRERLWANWHIAHGHRLRFLDVSHIAKTKGICPPKLLAILRRQPGSELTVVEDFQLCLNQVQQQVQFTIEYEENNNIAFLDCRIRRLDNGRLTTTVYCKPSDTNLIFNPQSCVHPDSMVGTFKGFLYRAHRICSTPQLLQEEISFLIDIWEDNEHNRRKLKRIADAYKPPSSSPPPPPPPSSPTPPPPPLPPPPPPPTDNHKCNKNGRFLKDL